MSFYRLFVIGLAVAALTFACSDKQKEAERLEQEMREMEGEIDTMGGPAEELDTISERAAPADVDAVPQEAMVEDQEAMPPAPAGEGYTVQVASCEDRDYARYLVSLYRGRGYEPFVTEYTLDGQLYYRVRVGNVATLAEARALKNELESKYSVPAWIDEYGY